MFGDILLKIKDFIKQQTCVHNYKHDRIGYITNLNHRRICDKCGKFE